MIASYFHLPVMFPSRIAMHMCLYLEHCINQLISYQADLNHENKQKILYIKRNITHVTTHSCMCFSNTRSLCKEKVL